MNDPLVVELRGLVIVARHGVYEEEQREGQRFVVDVRLTPRSALACETDRLGDAIDYGAVAEAVVRVTETRRFDLVERLAAVIGDTLLVRFPLERVAVTVHKPSAPVPHPFEDVAVTVERVRAGQH
jgi:dihydroneopterin aldolase